MTLREELIGTLKFVAVILICIVIIMLLVLAVCK